MGRRKALGVVTLMILVLSISTPVIANEDGKFNSSNGCSCHSSSSTSTTPTHNFPSSYTPSTSYSIQIGLTGGVSGTKGGFSLEVSQGTLSTGISIGSVQVNAAGNQATHTTSDYRSWGLYWESPSSGSGNVVFELAVLSANGNGGTSGDSWGTISPFTSVESVSQNTPPEASSLSFNELNPTKSTGLSINYTFFDADGDLEQDTEIRWKLNNLSSSSVDNLTSIPNNLIVKGDSWEALVTPNDGIDFGNQVSVGPIEIENSVPSILDIEITPENPNDDDNLLLNYEYFDLDGDLEQDIEINWYLDGVRQNEIDNLVNISNLMIRYGDTWQVSITPNDGEDFGETVWSDLIQIGSSNTPPEIDIEFFDFNFTTSDNLQFNIIYFDADDDDIQNTEINWYRNTFYMPNLDNLNLISNISTAKNDIWNFSARVNDGLAWSEWFHSDSILIENTPPVVISSTTSTENFTTADNISISWNQYDADGDFESNSKIIWFVNGISISDYDDLSTIPSFLTERDQIWQYQIIPNDGEDFGEIFTGPEITIVNAAPLESTISMKNGNKGFIMSIEENIIENQSDIFSNENLTLAIGYRDIDNDQITISILWSRNGFHVPELDNETHISSNLLSPGQTWSVIVKTTDVFGLFSESYASIIISNIPPVASMNDISNSIVPGSLSYLDGSLSTDIDGNIISWIWTINGQEISGQIINLVLEPGNHQIILKVTDDLGKSSNIQTNININAINTVNNLITDIDGLNVNIQWTWDGPSTAFNIYRSTSPIDSVIGLTSLDKKPQWGEPIPSRLIPIGITNETTWSEKVPIGAEVYYAITTYLDGEEVIWVSSDDNAVSVDASSAVDINLNDNSENSFLSIISSFILIIMGISSIILNLFLRRDKY
tara:strand:+ start:4879 stop:7548 length:2670 start_codon:yes stop_codon:yes gene_type:complete